MDDKDLRIQELKAENERLRHSNALLEKELEEYRELDEQGLSLKPPCNVGDTVYTNSSMQGWYMRKTNRPYKAKVVFIGINGIDDFMNVELGEGKMLSFKFSEIGKTVFLTEQEAQAALEKMKGE